MSNLPAGSIAVTGSTIPLATGEGGIETALSLLILVLAEAIKIWMSRQSKGGKDE
jgi:hypothetical protein